MLSGNKEEEYINLVFERIDDASVLSNFYCGIDEMDEFIHNKPIKTKKYSAVGFYSKCDFTPAEVPLSYKDTLRMYKVLHPTSPQE